MKYRVGVYSDHNYAVYEVNEGEDGYLEEELVFYGSLADCEAYIRLHESGYM